MRGERSTPVAEGQWCSLFFRQLGDLADGDCPALISQREPPELLHPGEHVHTGW
eukprot:CAMPEP_0170425424 /NCGR_PEP_ID=MMETSP0117_2-20130122/38099_1 /TAXON_ID=400756 /ORGANISM="Durinskia baltica, Strain CSIRO CS-38" /LENGTH=53 /DNA_ID=CAMNT_0010684389 /DNA_START=47 /DNA_END=205 /DNA_ORIENTATION=+